MWLTKKCDIWKNNWNILMTQPHMQSLLNTTMQPNSKGNGKNNSKIAFVAAKTNNYFWVHLNQRI